MKSKTISVILVGLLVIGGFIGLFIANSQVRAAGPTYVTGSITSDTTWSLVNSPYIVTGNVIVEAGATLTIEPGVEVKFDGVYSIIVDGTLYANGNSGNKITFTSNQTVPAKGDWYTIRLRTEDNLINYAEIEYATYGVFMTFFGANNIVSNTTVNNCKFDGIYITNSDYNTISDCTITSNDRYGITIYESHYTDVKDSIIQYNNYFGINLNASTYTEIQNCNISHNDGKGILLYSNSHHTTIIDSEIYNNNNKGIDLSGTSDNDIINTKVIANNGIGIDFGGETTDQWIENCDVIGNEGTGIDLRGSDYIDIIGCNISQNKENGGIYSGNEVSSVNILSTEIWNNLAGNGIDFYESNWINIINSEFKENTGDGLFFHGGTNNIVIKFSKIFLNQNGIYFDGNYTTVTEISVHNNYIHNNRKNGIHFFAFSGYLNSNTIQHNHIYSNTKNGICFKPNAADATANNNYISDNNIYLNEENGIDFSANPGGDADANYNDIYHNTIYENNQNGINFYLPYVLASTNNNNLIDNIIYLNKLNGISFISSNKPNANNIFNNNSITHNRYCGFYLSSTKTNTISNSDISFNLHDGINLVSSFDTHIYDTLISNNNWTGIKLTSSSSDSIIENIYVHSNNETGIFITNNSNDNVITHNEISSNSDTGLKIIDATGNQIHHNNFKSNTQNAYDSTIALNDWDDGSEGNYWSDYTGFDDDNDGFGEDPYVISGGGSRDWHPFMNPLNIIPDPSSFEIPLTTGWNLISLPLIQSDTSISTVLDSITGNYDKIEWYDGSDGKWHTTDDDLTDLDHTMGFWVHMKTADTLVVTGTVPDTTLISLYHGWNLVGNPSSSEQTIDVSLDSISGMYTAVQSYDSFDDIDHWKDHNTDKPQDLNDLTFMKRGCGYWIYVTENCVWGVNNS